MPKHPLQPFILDKDGDLCFKQNTIVRFLLEAGPFDLNQLELMGFSNEDRVQFAQLIGYSHEGWLQLPYVDVNDAQRADWQRIQFYMDKKGDESDKNQS